MVLLYANLQINGVVPVIGTMDGVAGGQFCSLFFTGGSYGYLYPPLANLTNTFLIPSGPIGAPASPGIPACQHQFFTFFPFP